jgi:hypothetical protein
MSLQTKIAIIGGGVAGVTVALHLASIGLDVTIFEKNSSLVDGPPWCHLHAGGNLYREISNEQCLTLLKQSIDFVKTYPFVVDYRPTVIAVPKKDPYKAKSLLPRLKILQKEYAKLVSEDSTNEVLSNPQDYFREYTREDLESLKQRKTINKPQTIDEWMISFAKYVDLNSLKFPVYVVQEYGLNIFRMAGAAKIVTDKIDKLAVKLDTEVTGLRKVDDQFDLAFKSLEGESTEEVFDYVVNAAGFKTGELDNMLQLKSERMVEFKASYVSQSELTLDVQFPEIIFHGERSTPQGMAQFTPYPGGFVQLHGMTNEITLYKDGLVKSTKEDAQPRLDKSFLTKIDQGWSEDEMQERTDRAINHVARYIPDFSIAKHGFKPLYGAQQIPGEDATLRVGEVQFPLKGYARCETVKVSSSIEVSNKIVEDLAMCGLIDGIECKNDTIGYANLLEENELDKVSQEIAFQREYPSIMATRNVAGI